MEKIERKKKREQKEEKIIKDNERYGQSQRLFITFFYDTHYLRMYIVKTFLRKILWDKKLMKKKNTSLFHT